MNKNTIAVALIAVVLAGSGGFYLGAKYGQPTRSQGQGGERSERMRQFGQGRGSGMGGNMNGGFIAGEILSKDEKSVTVKLRDGGSKIVFVSDSTQVMKSASGSLSDLQVGEQVTVMGPANSDGSVNAQSVQIRPVGKPVSPPEKTTTAPSTNTSVKEFTVNGSNFAFSPTTLIVKKGDKVRIIFKNEGGFHDLKIDEFNVATKKIQGGAQDTVEFTADKVGSFEYYCSIGEHRAMGMKGTLTVE